MTSPGQYASQDGSFGRSAGGAAGRGLVLIAIAIVVGLILLAKGFDGADTTLASSPAAGEPAPADETTTDDPTATDGTDADSENPADEGTSDPTTETTETVTTHPPSEVKVAAVNATGAPGVAGRATGTLDTKSYVTQAKNAVTNSEVSAVYYTANYAEDAKAVASALNIPADLIKAAPPDVLQLIENSENVTDFNIFIFQGADGQAGT